MKNTINKKLFIYFLFVYMITAIYGLLMAVAGKRGLDTGAFSAALMFLPASGVMLGNLLIPEAEKGGKSSPPKLFFLTFLAAAAFLAALAAGGMIARGEGMEEAANGLVGICSAVLFFELLCLSGKKREEWGLVFSRSWKKGLAGIIIFIGLHLVWSVLTTLTVCFKDGNLHDFIWNIRPVQYLFLPIGFALTYSGFLGEEYGWRYFLQPALQEKFGIRKGILLVGILWAVWHLPIDLFGGGFSFGLGCGFLIRLAGCMGKSIFTGWLYMRTKNIWAVAAVHFLNNNIAMMAVPAGLTTDWRNGLIIAVMYVAVYFPFLLLMRPAEGQLYH